MKSRLLLSFRISLPTVSTRVHPPNGHTPQNGQSCGYFSESTCTLQNPILFLGTTRKDSTGHFEGCGR